MELRVSLADQRMELLNEEGEVVQAWSVSTAAKGAGELAGSYQTPRGRHLIRAKIGAGLPLNTVFRARRPTG